MQYFNDFLKIFLTFIIIMDPVGNIPAFFSITGDFDVETRNSILRKAIVVAGVVLLVFGVLGKILLGFFGISAGAFYISGGILFFTIAGDGFSLLKVLMTVLALFESLTVQYFTMRSGAILIRLIGTTGMFVLEKIMGLILAALSIQLVYEGLVKLNILAPLAGD